MRRSIIVVVLGPVLATTALLQFCVFFGTEEARASALSYHSILAKSIERMSTTTVMGSSTTQRCASSSSYSSSCSSSNVPGLPDIQALTTAPFQKQVQFGMELTSLLDHKHEMMNANQLKELLKAQLSHSDGIRGFMVAYLSSGYNGDDNNYFEIPSILLEVLNDQLSEDIDSNDDLILLMCMNVVMPTAMVTIHQDAAQSANSARTARRGIKVLQAVQNETPVFSNNLKAIQHVAAKVKDGSHAPWPVDESLVQYWSKFFDKWGYQSQQAADIERTMDQLIAESQ